MIYIKDVITSRNNPKVKWAASLSDKKQREASRSFLAEGRKLVFEALSAGLPVTEIFVSVSVKDRISDELACYRESEKFESTAVYFLEESVFNKISTEKAPDGVICVIKYLDFFFNMDIIYKEEFFVTNNERAIILCSVRDPQNLGSVIRSAVAFGVEHIIVSSDCADIYNPKTVRSAMGSLFRVKVTRVASLPDFISAAKENGRRVFAAELSDGAKSLSEIELNATDLLMIGNEGHGIPKETSALCTASVYIPISSKTESLNASVAAAIFMWEQSKE
ncbi:MAG: RNA methyltransferase [Clostridia bacterium]|nr:RNA methyltransferase [Clostridia bacterium]